MARQVHAHETTVSIVKQAPAELAAGIDFALKVMVACPSKCNLQGTQVRITDEQGVAVKEIELVSFDGTANETAEFLVTAPAQPGEYTWRAVLAAQEHDGILQEESSAPLSFVAKPHTTSMAVWNVPSAIVSNSKFAIKVGVQCSAKCSLAGSQVEIYDHAGAQVGTGALGDVRWSDTGALYWAEIELQAPDKEGYYTWEAKFPKAELELAHEQASYGFAFQSARQPEHVLTVEVLDNDTNAPLKHAEVILHPYRDHTDEHGLARLMVPKGDYELYVSASDKKIYHTTVKVSSDLAVRAELLAAPIEDQSG